ncbi:MAG TPA: hypothetical protein VMT60_04335 [Candidatus Bathyarchaeia archaeon]|nr:hypothetical protein [Candidatus Bathyarchaeia archaeon]
MKGHAITILFLAMGLMLSPIHAAGSMPSPLQLQFDFEGTGNAILVSPPLYSGTVVAGDPLVLGGTWWIRIDDSTWPSVSNPQARWNYLFSHMTWDPGSFSWTIALDAHTCATKPVWQISHPTNGMMGGTLVVVLTFTDWNHNGILDLEERTFGVFSGTLIVMKYGTVQFAGYCGDGSYNGALNNADPANWADDYVEGSCLLNLQDCRVATQEASWTSIKRLFK